MKIIILAAIIITLFPPCLHAETINNEQGDWYPFVIPGKLDPDSPANIGKLVLDAPAGKHGFVKAKDGHFYFEDGTRAKFWGTNLCFNACFPTHKQAELLADRLAFFGFNAVRLHHMDFYFEPNGIFEDISPAYKDPQMKKTTKLSKKQLDKLDYLMYQLKQRGIYIDMNLLVARHFTEADGVKQAGSLDMAAKPYSMFDRKLIELQKKYTNDLLTHYNPYTKTRYCDDPVIALLEITNENSIIDNYEKYGLHGFTFGIKKKSNLQYYVDELDGLWNDWLKEKYGTEENVKNAWKQNKPSNYVKQPAAIPLEPQKWSIELHDSADANLTVEQNSSVINIVKVTGTSWHIQYKISGISLEKNNYYTIKFSAKSDKEVSIGLVAQQSAAPYENAGLSELISLSKEIQSFEIPFLTNNDYSNTKIAFLMDNKITAITIKDVSLNTTDNIEFANPKNINTFKFHRPHIKLKSLYPKKCFDDLADFYIDLEKKYFAEMLHLLRNELGVKAAITGIGGIATTSNIIAEESCDFIDRHPYWDQPRFPHKVWDQNDFTIHNKSLIQDKNLGFITRLNTFGNEIKPRKPFTMTEWNHCYPNRYAYETPCLFAAYANNNGWDALFQFDYSGGWKFEPSFDNISNQLDIIANSQQLILSSIGSYIYLNDAKMKFTSENGVFKLVSPQIVGFIGSIKNMLCDLRLLSLTPKQNGAVFLYSTDNTSIEESKRLVLLTMGGVMNSGSGCKNNKFDWGAAPVLLENLHADITLYLNKKIKIYELSSTGERTNPLTTFNTNNSKTPIFEIVVEQN